ncbi:unnamed protein product [Microthlaspi erraticum]|uniref:F-box associated beta-propeller type 1 domain-containing protein n=1 Tax=Microthlaspi erraticum TaxID=1685480 RepID=A0A6D2J9M9_9BRAS|nr:unnamed protein product [Microthlaspi erraticum]
MTMTTISDIPPKLVGKKILRRVPITSLGAVRSACKLWNSLSRDWFLGKAAAKQQFLGFMTMESKVCSVRFDLFKDKDRDDRGLVDISVKHVAALDQVEISKVHYCKGLVLCVLKDSSSLVAWNPYLGQTRRIKPSVAFHTNDMYALGYDKKSRSHKIVRYLDGLHSTFGTVDRLRYEIYDFSSDAWRVLDVTPHWNIECYHRGASLKGNSYFFAQEKVPESVEVVEYENFLICFDFTSERFGKRLALPFQSYIEETVTLACVREEQLAVLYQRWETLLEVMQIWVTTKIDPNSVSWSRFLKVDMRPLCGFQFEYLAASFFIDEEKKVAVVFDFDKDLVHNTAYIVGVDGYFKSVRLGEARDRWFRPLVCSSSYLPSLVQINNQRRKRKKRDV